MRILFLVSSMEGGGAERVAALLSNEWARQGHEVILMPTFSGRGEVSYPLAPAVRLDFLADRTLSPLARTPVGRLMALRNAVSALAPDVVLSFLTNVNVAAILAGGSAPIVVSERIYPPAFRMSRFWETMRRITYARAATVVMQTRQGAQWLKDQIPRSRGVVIGNPILMPLPDTEPRRDPVLFAGPGERMLLSVGRLDPQKNFPLLIDGFAGVSNHFPRWKLAIVGEGATRPALQAQINRLGLSDQISLVGRTGNLDAWYRRANAFAFTSMVEGFPNALLEALAYGLPSLALDCPTGPAELIEHNVNGVLLPLSSTADDVSFGLSILLSEDWPATAAASERTIATYRIDNVARDWIQLFERLRAERASW